jgi:hypothetical protein
MSTRLLVVIGLMAAWVSSPFAQEHHALRFEVVENGTLVARPVFTVNDGSQGSLVLDGAFDIKFTPTRVSAETVAVAFEITASGNTLRPRLTLLKDEPGTLTWKAGSTPDAFELRVALAPPAR